LERNHFAAVEILLSAGADINAAPSKSEGLTALFASVECQKLELVQRLLRTANPNGETTRESPLIRAAELGATDIVQCLIQAGANVNYYDRDYPETALEIAVARGHISVVHILLAAGADINGSTSEMGRHKGSPLERAVENGRTELVELLLSKEANPNSFPDCALPNSTALGRALCRRPINWQILHLLVAAGADVNRASAYQGMPLPTGAKNLEVVHFLLKAGAKVNGTAPDGATALQVSVMSNNIDIIRVLLRAEADVNAPAGQTRGLTALQAAAKQGKPHLVSLLLQHGADPNAPAGEVLGATALQAAAIGGHLRIALMLLKAGADVNAPPAKFGGRTALEAAAEHGRLDLVSLLLKNDTDIESLEVRCKKAAGLAISNGNIFISKFLNEYKTD
jgi:ankyrin repeat protein